MRLWASPVNIAAVLRELMAAGLSGDALVDAVERIESAPSKSSNAARQQRYRDRQKEAQTVTRNVTSVTNVTQSTPPAFPLDVPPKEISNPPLNPPITPHENFRPIAKIDPFDAFWRAYPRRTAKLAAQKAFASAIKRGADPNAMTAAAQSFADSPDRDPQFTPHPATWLNQGRYDDQPQEIYNGRTGKPERNKVTDNPMVLAFARMAGHIDADGNPTPGARRCDATGSPPSAREHSRPALVALPRLEHH